MSSSTSLPSGNLTSGGWSIDSLRALTRPPFSSEKTPIPQFGKSPRNSGLSPRAYTYPPSYQFTPPLVRYNGRPTPPPDCFTPLMEIACQEVEKCVNAELAKRSRFPLEYVQNEWKANVAAVNCYAGSKEGVGLHSDQLTYLGPYPTIASVSLGTTRKFRLREIVPREEVGERKAQTIDIPLPHNSLIIMHASAQENYKHAIPTQRAIDAFRPSFTREGTPTNNADSLNIRINITFRFYRPDFKPTSIPRCLCDVPCILRPDMKGRNSEGVVTRFWWACYSGAQNEGKGCSLWRVMDFKTEKRGQYMVET